MYVGVIHRVSDPEAFMKAEDEAIAAGLPEGFSLPIHAATHDHGRWHLHLGGVVP
jgi:hypothetical protein